MNTTITLGVYRRLDNRFEGLSDDSPRALELHNRRKDALHAVLDGDPIIRVTDWGDTDDTRPHECVEVLLKAATAVFHYAIVPGVKWLGLKFAEKGVDPALSEFAKAVVAKLRPKHANKLSAHNTYSRVDLAAAGHVKPSQGVTDYLLGTAAVFLGELPPERRVWFGAPTG